MHRKPVVLRARFRKVIRIERKQKITFYKSHLEPIMLVNEINLHSFWLLRLNLRTRRASAAKTAATRRTTKTFMVLQSLLRQVVPLLYIYVCTRTALLKKRKYPVMVWLSSLSINMLTCLTFAPTTKTSNN